MLPGRAWLADSSHGYIIACDDIGRLLFVKESGSVVVGSGNGPITVFDVESCNRKAVWNAHGSAVSCRAASPEMQVLVSSQVRKMELQMFETWRKDSRRKLPASFPVPSDAYTLHQKIAPSSLAPRMESSASGTLRPGSYRTLYSESATVLSGP